jgi:hypothetical protein
MFLPSAWIAGVEEVRNACSYGYEFFAWIGRGGCFGVLKRKSKDSLRGTLHKHRRRSSK